jgi:trimethylamine:corrinoid methyltransferase-like protein
VQRLMSQGSALRESVEAFRLPDKLTKTTVMTAPSELSLLISDIQRCAVQVGVKPVNLAALIALQMVNPCQRTPCFKSRIN